MIRQLGRWLAGLSLLLCLPAWAEPLRIGLLGDVPYTAYERRQLPLILDAMVQENLDVIIHLGDIKNGSSPCDDDVYLDIHNVFQAVPLPVVYVPGDNEWQDCRRLSAGRHDPLERLRFLRQTFFATPNSLGQQALLMERQAGFPENARWRMGPLLLISLNMPGHDNNVGSPAEFAPRNEANLTWLKAAFERVKAQRLRGLIILTQANPYIEADNEGAAKPGFRAFLDLLRAETATYDGQVLLAHGDTHAHQINQPLKDRKTRQPIANFTRVETYGFPFLGWVKVVADPDMEKLFRFESHPWNTRLPGQ